MSQNKGLLIEFNPPVSYTPPRPNPILYSKIHVMRMVDDPILKQVVALTDIGNFILWEQSSYDEIGQWTDVDVANRLKELLNS